MIGVNVGCNLEDEARELVFFGIHGTFLCLDWTGTGSNLHKTVQHFLHAEVVQCRAEEYWRHFRIAVAFHIKLGIHAVHQFQVLTQFCRIGLTHLLVQFLAVQVHTHFFRHLLLVGRKEVQVVFINVIHALETHTLVDGPAERAHLYLEFFFQFIQQVKGIAALAVHLVYIDDNRGLAHAADGHQLACLRLHTLGAVHHNDGAVHGRKGTERILGKVLVTGSVQNVHLISLIVKLHHTGGHADSALLFNLHPVAGGRFLYLVTLYRTGNLNLASEEQQFFRQGCLTGIGMGYDGKCPSSLNFLVHIFIYDVFSLLYSFESISSRWTMGLMAFSVASETSCPFIFNRVTP